MKNIIRNVLNQRGKKNVVILIAVFLLFLTACGSNVVKDGEEALPATETAGENNNSADMRSHSMRTPFLLTISDTDKELTSEIQALSKVYEIRRGVLIKSGNDYLIIEYDEFPDAPWCGNDVLFQDEIL